MKKKVNIHYICRLFDPLFSLSDEEVDNLSTLNLNDEFETKIFFQQRVVDNFKQYGIVSRDVCRNSLQYILCVSSHKYNFSDLFPYGELPVEQPNNINLFFTWLWQTLFSNEDINECDENQFVVMNNYNEPNSSYIK